MTGSACPCYVQTKHASLFNRGGKLERRNDRADVGHDVHIVEALAVLSRPSTSIKCRAM